MSEKKPSHTSPENLMSKWREEQEKRLEPAPPFVDRFKDVFDYYEQRLANKPNQDHDPEISR